VWKEIYRLCLPQWQKAQNNYLFSLFFIYFHFFFIFLWKLA